MTEGTAPEATTEKKPRKKSVFRFNYRLTTLEQSILVVCAEQGIDDNQPAQTTQLLNQVIKQAEAPFVKLGGLAEAGEDVKFLRRHRSLLQHGAADGEMKPDVRVFDRVQKQHKEQAENTDLNPACGVLFHRGPWL